MTLSSVKHTRRTPVPILLNEFPVPPTFIPQSISSTPNPPPSRPPSLPLPPVPGPSPLSEHDLFQITAAARSRRASRLSTSSNSSSWRGSVASLGSASSRPPSLTVPTTSAQPSQQVARSRTDSVASTSALSVRSFSSQNGPLSVPFSSKATARTANPDNHRPSPMSMTVNPAILEDDEFTIDALESSLPYISRASPSPNPHVADEFALHGERLSSIDMRDLPTLQDDDASDLDPQAHSFYIQRRAARSKSPVHKSRTRQATSQPQPNGISTTSTAHRRTSSATQHTRNREPFHDTNHAPTAFPGKSLPDGPDRASSPDVASIIAATPRPRRRSETSSAGSRSGSRSRRRAHKSLPGSSHSSATGRLSVFSLPDEAARQGSASLASRSLLANSRVGDGLWHDDLLPEDYGVEIGGGDGDFGNVPDENDTAGDSDSSLDLHTPLPSLMLRDGLLSPHSKLLPQNIHPDTPVVTTDGNRHSTTKSGVFKDERDTTRRRVRHRDGRLLRGGIGLTTGLGWSDSEDEDAPSPLTKRLSRLALSRQTSVASLKSVSQTSHSQPHPLSRSYSGDAKVYSSKSHQNLRRPSLPPTSWPGRSRTVTSTLSLNIPEQNPSEPAPTTHHFSEPLPSCVDIQADSQRNDQVRTPSSSSTQSLPGPSTPDVMDVPPHSPPIQSWDRDKSLPPIPLSRGPSMASPRPIGSSADMKSRPPNLDTLPLRRPISSGSEVSDSPVMPPHTPKLPHPHTPTRTTPRPLRLSASFGTGLQPGEPVSMQGRLLNYNRQLHDQQRARASSGPSSTTSSSQRYSVRPLGPGVSQHTPRSGSVDLSLSELGEPRLRPRTGTGMVYKKSSTSLTRAAAVVQAQSRIRMPSERVGSVVS